MSIESSFWVQEKDRQDHSYSQVSFQEISILDFRSTLPVKFELIAMLAKSVHIPGSRFRRLPNPCADTWYPGLDIAACLAAFASNINDCSSLGDHKLTTELQELFQHGRMDALHFDNGQTLVQKITKYSEATTCLAHEKAGHYYYLQEDERQSMEEKAIREYNTRLLDLLDSLHWAVERVDERLEDMVHTPVFGEVIALHLTAVLDQQAALNMELAMATRENSKENILMNFYFSKIFPAAVKASPQESGNQTPDSASSHSGIGSDATTLSPAIVQDRSAIWLGLMFKLWSWLFLHDFNPEDKMIERSDFMNNRLPIYIG
jgi:hypothetical protein